MNKVFINDTQNAVPLFTQNPNVILEHYEDRYSLKNQKLPKPLKLNKTSHHILELCDGKHTIKEITKIMLKEYENVSYDRIENDIINVLYPLWKFKFIMFREGQIPFVNHLSKKCENGFEFQVEYLATEMIKIINTDRENAICNDNQQVLTKADFNISFMYNSRIYFTLSKNDKRLLTLNLIPYYISQPYNDAVSYLTDCIDIVSLEEIDETLLNEFLYWCIKFYNNEINVKQPKKCEYLYFKYMKSLYTGNKKNFLEKMNWNHVTEVEKDYLDQDTMLFEKKINFGS